MRSKGPYWIPKNRRQELRYFTLQYWDYKKKIQEVQYLAIFSEKGSILSVNENAIFKVSGVEELAIETTRYREYIDQIDQAIEYTSVGLEEILDGCKKNTNTGQMTLFYWELDKLHV